MSKTKRRTWRSKLTKPELKHLEADAGCKTLDSFRQNRRDQKKLDPEKEVCFVCRSIAIKLGIEK